MTEVDTAQTLELLQYVRERQLSVRIHRAISGADRLDGIVLAASTEWLLLAEVHNTELDGYQALRTRDVDRVTVSVGREAIDIRALKAFGSWPPRIPAYVELGSLRDVLDMAAAHDPLVHIELEVEDPGAAYIGRVVEVSDAEVTLLEITPHAEWEERPETFPAADITRVAFGARYERALHVLGGDPPG